MSIRPRGRRLLRAVALYVVLPYVAVTALFAIGQRKLMYRPMVADRLPVAEFATSGLPHGVDVGIETPDGALLRGWYLTAEREDASERTLVIYFPGQSLNRAERVDDLLEIVRLGYDVLIFDYRGYGDSSGRPSEERLSQDATRVFNFAIEELAFPSDRIILFGESLGGAVVLSMWRNRGARDRRPGGIVLSSTFASMSDVVGHHYPAFPFRYLLFDDWDSIGRLASMSDLDFPVTIFHGTADEMVPVSQARALAAVRPTAELVEIEHGFHNEVPRGALKRALDRIARRSDGPADDVDAD